MASTGQFNVFCSGRLSVELHRPGILGMFRGAISGNCVDFSTTGIRLETPSKLSVGENLVLDLAVNDIRLEELPAIVRRASATAEGNCYDIDFVPEGTGRGNTMHCLRNIDSHIRSGEHRGV